MRRKRKRKVEVDIEDAMDWIMEPLRDHQRWKVKFGELRELTSTMGRISREDYEISRDREFYSLEKVGKKDVLPKLKFDEPRMGRVSREDYELGEKERDSRGVLRKIMKKIMDIL